MPHARLAIATGAILLLLATSVMLAWIAQVPGFMQRDFGPAMVFNTALCFALAALAVLLNDASSSRRILPQQLLGGTIVLICVLVLSQSWFEYSLGIDWPELHRWPGDSYPHPGRMSKTSSFAFFLCGAVLILMHQVRHFWTGLLVQSITLVIAAIGIVGLAGIFLELGLVYPNYLFGRVAAPTMAGFVLLSGALWLCWRGAGWYRSRALIRDEGQRVSLTGAAILGAVVALSVVAGFNIAQRELEATVSEGLLQALKSQTHLFTNSIEQRVLRAQLVTTRPGAISHLRHLNARPDDAAALGRLREVAESFLPLGFSAIAFSSPEGREWLNIGRFAGQPELTVRLNLPHASHLMWDRGLVLNSRMPMTSGAEIVGWLVAEQPLRDLRNMHGDIGEFGETGEVAVCTLRDWSTHCFPQRLMPRVFSVPYSEAFPMARALAGQTDIMKTRDYRRQNVIAAHGPIGDLGLGMVVKMDTAELYTPIRQHFNAALLLLLALTIGGAMLLYWRLKPLVSELERSRELVREKGERALRESEERYRYLFEVNPMPMWVRDRDTYRFLAVNDAAVEFYGYTREEFLSMTTHDIHAPDDLEAYRERIRLRDESADHLYTRHRHRKKDGTVMAVEASSRLIEFDGRPARLVLLNDLSERLRAEEAHNPDARAAAPTEPAGESGEVKPEARGTRYGGERR